MTTQLGGAGAAASSHSTAETTAQDPTGQGTPGHQPAGNVRATPTPGEALMRVSGLHKAFPDGAEKRVVLADLDLAVPTGQITCVQGPSGCGKSTLLHIVGMLAAPDSGAVEFDGAGVTYNNRRELARLRRHHVGLVLQNLGLMENESVRANVELPLLYGVRRYPRSERTRLIAEALDRAHVDVPLRKKVRKLSGGQKQRIAVARAIVHHPRLVVADEPTASLDEAASVAVCGELRSIADAGAGVVIATHDPAVAAACDVVHRFDGHHLTLARG